MFVNLSVLNISPYFMFVKTSFIIYWFTMAPKEEKLIFVTWFPEHYIIFLTCQTDAVISKIFKISF